MLLPRGMQDKRQDAKEIYQKILSADGFIFATPNYFNNMSGLLKNFFDRTNPFALKKKLAGKKAAIIVVGGQKKTSLGKCEDTIREFCRIHGIRVIGSELITADKLGDAEKNKKQWRNAGSLEENLRERFKRCC